MNLKIIDENMQVGSTTRLKTMAECRVPPIEHLVSEWPFGVYEVVVTHEALQWVFYCGIIIACVVS